MEDAPRARPPRQRTRVLAEEHGPRRAEAVGRDREIAELPLDRRNPRQRSTLVAVPPVGVEAGLPPSERGGHHEDLVECWHDGLVSGGVIGYSREDAWRDDRLGSIMATLNPVLYGSLLRTGGARGTAPASAMITRFFTDLVECGAEAVIP